VKQNGPGKPGPFSVLVGANCHPDECELPSWWVRTLVRTASAATQSDDVDIQLPRIQSQIEEVLHTTPAAGSGTILIAPTLVVRGIGHHRISTIKTRKGNVAAMGIRPYFIPITVHYKKVRDVHDSPGSLG
jgi:hypothetical protein